MICVYRNNIEVVYLRCQDRGYSNIEKKSVESSIFEFSTLDQFLTKKMVGKMCDLVAGFCFKCFFSFFCAIFVNMTEPVDYFVILVEI